jgi:hypothetical protein
MSPSPTSLFLKDIRSLSALPCAGRYTKLRLYEYPFDHQLLSLSELYRESRKQYLALGGRYSPRVSSTMRSLSAQDLFADDIDYTPASTELTWFAERSEDVYDPENEVIALERFNTISVFHEQNHRILWRLLPPAPKEERDLIRYLNFAESLVVMLDLALADEIGPTLSPIFERMKITYRTGRTPKKLRESRSDYRHSLLAMCAATYFILELMNPEDILKAVDYVLPGRLKLNRDAVSRALDISELFIRITNPQWQEREWKSARNKLTKMHKSTSEAPLYLPEDPLDFDEEFVIARSVLDHFGL